MLLIHEALVHCQSESAEVLLLKVMLQICSSQSSAAYLWLLHLPFVAVNVMHIVHDHILVKTCAPDGID